MHAHTHTQTDRHTHTHTHRDTHAHACTHTHAHRQTDTHRHTHTLQLKAFSQLRQENVNECMSVVFWVFTSHLLTCEITSTCSIVVRTTEHPQYPETSKFVRVNEFFSKMVIEARSNIYEVGYCTYVNACKQGYTHNTHIHIRTYMHAHTCTYFVHGTCGVQLLVCAQCCLLLLRMVSSMN